MSKRPLSVLLLGWLFVIAGTVGLIYHSRELIHELFPRAGVIDSREVIELIGITLGRVLGILAGVGLIYGRNWARWLCLAWIGFHVVISIWHSTFQVVFHAVFFVVIAFILFRRPATEYFQRAEG
ncbi:MAG TPA: hypothetical protein VGN86_15955 [Pyrinomonadaceae bacterium]|jgi:hypothetical protein|nr:hypothetical protein [Pyrinomonadaceae bacterium]